MSRAGSLPLARIVERISAGGVLAPGAHVPGEVELWGVSQDSRAVKEGDLFLAWQGTERDGHDFIGEAVKRGAAAALVERPLPEVSVPQVVVRDGRLAGALAADEIFGSPCRNMFVYAVTGTNGKTTTTLLARHLLRAGGPSAAIGTLGLVDVDGEARPSTASLTTPGPVQLSGWMRSLADAGVRHLGLEASSHSLDQRRLDGVRFDAVAFTNLSRDHLDYHPDMASYYAAKARAIDLAVPGGTVVVNADDSAWVRLDTGPRRRLSYGVEADAALTATSLELGPEGTRFELTYEGRALPVSMPLLGRFNVENALAAAGIALAAGRRVDEVANGLASAPSVPGRMELVTDRPCPVVIDFAHTPDALVCLLDTLRPLASGRLIVLFGAGGDRDRSKRPRMGRAVAERADLAIVTSDNPRTEDPDAILDDVVAGMAGADFERLPDRRAAIGRALDLAAPEDLVVLVGKGHETCQVIGREKISFDEREIVLAHPATGGRAA